MIYDKAYFIAKFEAIPDELWCTDSYTDNEKHCALGHCGEGVESHTEESVALGALLRNPDVDDINDGVSARYQQPTPKARILAALHDLP